MMNRSWIRSENISISNQFHRHNTKYLCPSHLPHYFLEEMLKIFQHLIKSCSEEDTLILLLFNDALNLSDLHFLSNNSLLVNFGFLLSLDQVQHKRSFSL
ncbi:hypothetical protein P9112_002181 [Eukaryota sp. TZLM1-RC]